MDPERQTSGQQLRELALQSEAVADELASKATHPRLWEIYRASAHRGLLRHAIGIPTQPDEARHAC